MDLRIALCKYPREVQTLGEYAEAPLPFMVLIVLKPRIKGDNRYEITGRTINMISVRAKGAGREIPTIKMKILP